jgi:hypothetical protein
MVKVSSFMVGTIVVALIITLFNVFLAGLNDAYTTSDYDSSTLDAYNKLDDLNTQSESIKDEVSAIKENPNVLDVIGGFFTSGYKALKLTYTSFDTFDTMLNSAMTDANLGKTGEYIKIAIGTIVIILLFVAVVISAILKYKV